MRTIDHSAGSIREAVTAGRAKAGGFSPMEVIAPAVVIAYTALSHGDYHLAASHHDPIAYGTELALVACLIFVGGRLVAARRLRSPI